MKEQPKIAVIGLGYVGLPLARLFATKFPVVGFDINAARVEELQKGHDSTLEVEDEVLKAVLVKRGAWSAEPAISRKNNFHGSRHPELDSGSNMNEFNVTSSEVENSPGVQNGLYVTHNLEDIANCNYYIITVPTPIDKNNRPDLAPLYKSSESVGKVLKKGDIVIYESTVYPGVTEDECVPVLERVSGLKFNNFSL